MNEVTLPPSPNWYLSSVLASAKDGTIAWGARNAIVIAKSKNDSKGLEYSIIQRAHPDKVTTLAFSPREQEDSNYQLVSGGDDHAVRIWNLTTLTVEMINTKLEANNKIVGVDWSNPKPNLICFISDKGSLVAWNIDSNSSQLINLGKLTATCLSCCPHNENITAVGCKSGLIFIVDVWGSGTVKYKLRGHDSEIVSLSWCPVPLNVLDDQSSREFLLASGAKDRNIFLWKAGTDGRYQVQISLPTSPVDAGHHKGRVSSSAGNFTSVCWLEPTSLLSSSPWGELLLWNLSGNVKRKLTPQLIHSQHGKGLFAITGSVDYNSDEHLESSESENWRSKTDIKAIWTIGQERQVVCCGIVDNEPSIKFAIPTQGGFVYCISACPVDTSQIAFGVGDAMIRLWNLSEPHESTMDLQMLWEKIMGQVRALAWHPEKENLLAFATNEGRVGIFDTNASKPPVLCRQYHRHIIYSLAWGPAPNVNQYALYVCGDGELVYYNPEKLNENPTIVMKKKNCTEFCWKPDYSMVALGFGDGSITFLDRELTSYGKTISVLSKSIQRLVWHPESTSSDLNISPMQNYLAVATTEPTVTVFDISLANNSGNSEEDEFPFYKTVATLSAHAEKVVCLAWSPHISGYLVSGSYDKTAQVWKIETQEVIATYISHLGPIQCCMWSPFSQDLIMTGSVDFTLRIWSISNQKIVKSVSASKLSTKGKRTKKKKIAEESSRDIKTNGITQELKKSEACKSSSDSKNTSIGMIESDIRESNKSSKKKKPKRPNYFPGHSEIAQNKKLWSSYVSELTSRVNSNVSTQNGVDHSIPQVGANNISSNPMPILLGSKSDLEIALDHEKKILDSNGHYNIVAEIDLWQENLEESLSQAMKENKLSDFSVSIAPSISKEFWRKVCEAYAWQLVAEENPTKAVSYFLSLNKVREAIVVLVAAKLFREAYILSTLRLDPKDPGIPNILERWAEQAEKDGNFQSAAECHIKLGQLSKAAKLIERRKDLDSLQVAFELAKSAEDCDLSLSLADKIVQNALLSADIGIARSMLEKFSEIQFREVEIEVFHAFSEALQSVNDETILNWLKGLSNINVLSTLNDKFTKCSKKYSLLLQKDVLPLFVDEVTMQLNVSHQIALSVLTDERKKQLQHIVTALESIVQNEENLPMAKGTVPTLMKYLFALDNNKLTSPDSIFNQSEHCVSKSLRAYLCYAIINWYHESKFRKEENQECMDLIVYILEKYVGDLLDKESVKFRTTSNDILKLESELSTNIGKSQSGCETQSIIERLDQLRSERRHFLENQISAPNPLFAYSSIMEFISEIKDEELRSKATNIVMDAWNEAISPQTGDSEIDHTMT
ncbi:hypothetical protein QAD02_011519 [Eretmocerus hayati]|uniref:Uncharacterized protein n=1 Tax=Eretmocerus hayati TaxID=131215 RepID=A0ACC2NXZ5_9HYME|nr:hypothetical protein QAD02_011519 [Eretmocerus hayati]